MIQIEMEMADKCSECRFQTDYGFCSAKPKNFCGATSDEGKPNWCPLKNANGWISVKDRLPAETHSIFYRFFGTKIWRNSMWREQSDKVLVTVVFKDGTKIVTTGETHDGIWNTTISRTLEPVISHWMPLPEPPKEGKPECD